MKYPFLFIHEDGSLEVCKEVSAADMIAAGEGLLDIVRMDAEMNCFVVWDSEEAKWAPILSSSPDINEPTEIDWPRKA